MKNNVKLAKNQSWTKFEQKMKEGFKENQKIFYSTLKQERMINEYNMVHVNG